MTGQVLAMPYLLYCVSQAGAAEPPPRGVRGAAVEDFDCDGLRCYFSVLKTASTDSEKLKRDALDFHQVTRSLFRQTAIIPFRFPTIVSSMAELGAYLRDHAGRYHDALRQFGESVQMELRVSVADSPSGEASSGTQYLQSRAQRSRWTEDTIAACRTALGQEVIDWRQRESAHGVRCFALVRRAAWDRVQDKLQQVRLDPGVIASISGPWPPTEFFADLG